MNMVTEYNYPDEPSHREPDDTMVICPNCTHQFRAISVADQARLRAQSDAEPVAWQYRIKQGGWGGWHEAAPTKAEALSCIEAQQRLGLVDEYELRPLYTAPPRPEVSGLIEAAEWRIISEALRIAREDGSIDNFATDAECETLKEKIRARAADRSGK